MTSCDLALSDEVKKFLIENDFYNIKPLGKGGFGEVLSAISPKKDYVAIKRIKNELSWHLEETFWPTFHHDNILNLLDVISIKRLDLKLYAMPRHPYVLMKILTSSPFLADMNGLMRVKRWFSDVLNGLDYLHGIGFAHGDIKSDIVLITSDDRALLCDFSGLSHIDEPLKR